MTVKINQGRVKNNMKNSNIAAAISAVLILAASAAMAGDIVDFDGKKGAAISFAELRKTADSGSNIKSQAVAPAAQGAVAADAIRIDVTMKNGSTLKTETLSCQAGPDQKTVTECKKQSDLSALTSADISDLALQRFFPDLIQTKHSYDGHSGPQTFHCDDLCARWTTVKRCIKAEVGSGGICIGYEEEQVCTSWTHECTCTSNCY
jgi:hypothetical protein